jgi:hypothetical protein
MRIHVALPMPCYHEFCRKCLNTMFELRKTQDGANICPLCRAPWFKAEYVSRQAQARRTAEAGFMAQPSTGTANRPTRTAYDVYDYMDTASLIRSTARTSTFSSQTATNTTETMDGDIPQQPPRRTPRPYARTAQLSAPPTPPPLDWRSLPVFLAREIRDAINRQQAESTTPTAAPPPTQLPVTGPSSQRPATVPSGPSSWTFGQQPTQEAPRSQRPATQPAASGPSQLGQQPKSATTASVLDPILGPDFFSNVFNNDFFEGINNAAQQASRKRPVPSSFTAQENRTRMAQSAEAFRQAELNVRAAQFHAREFEQRQQQANPASQRARNWAREAEAEARVQEREEAARRRGQ